MRFVFKLVVVCAAISGATARADVGVSLFGQASRYAEQPQRAGGLAVELSIDRPRWQYLAELAFGSVLLGDDDLLANSDGVMVRGGIGARYLARRFEMERILAFELGFEALVGAQDLEWRARTGRERDVRPEIAAGFSWNFEFTKWGFASRWSVRAVFAPAPDAMTSQAACIGTCTTRERVVAGYMVLMGVTW